MKKTKITILIVSFIFTVLLFKIGSINNYCYVHGQCGFLQDITNSPFFAFLLFLSLLVFPFFSDNLFYERRSFSCMGNFYMCLDSSLSSNNLFNSKHWFWFFLNWKTAKGWVALFMSCLFVIISVIIILISFIETRKKKVV